MDLTGRVFSNVLAHTLTINDIIVGNEDNYVVRGLIKDSEKVTIIVHRIGDPHDDEKPVQYGYTQAVYAYVRSYD